MGSTQVRSTQTRATQTGSINTLLVCCLAAVAPGMDAIPTCKLAAFKPYMEHSLLMCALSSPFPNNQQNFIWYFTNSVSNLTSETVISDSCVLQDANVSFINVSLATAKTGYFVCNVSDTRLLNTTCSLKVTTTCPKYSPGCLDLGTPLYMAHGIDEGVNKTELVCNMSQPGYTLKFTHVVALSVDTCNNPVKAPALDPQPQTVHKAQGIVTANLTQDPRITITTPPPALLVPTPPKPNITSPDTGGCHYFPTFDPANNPTAVKIDFFNFQAQCQGVYTFWNTGLITAALFLLKNANQDDNDGEDEFKWTPVIVVVPLLVVAAVVVAVVVVVRRRRLLHNSRFPLRNKMVSTISGSKVHMFNNMAYSKEEKSDLEEFPRKHIRFLDTIGKGTFGTVVMAEALNLLQKKKGPMSRNWAKVAVKMTLISDKSNEELKTDFLCELALMKTIPPHVNIITLYASCTAHDPYLMILEYARHGDLRKFLLEHRMERNYANAAFSAYGVSHKKEKHYASAACAMYDSCSKKDKFEANIYAVPGETRYSEFPATENDLVTSRDLLSFALQICRGLEHLVRNRIVHRDVAARNVLLFDHHIVKISDFGLARKVGQGDVYERTRKGLLPIRWMSPESLFYNQFTEKSDVWSYGVLLWELITLGSTPYPGLDANTVLEKLRARELLVCPPHSSTIVNNIVNSCWRENPEGRPTFVQLCLELEQLLEAEVEYVDLDQMNDHEYSTLDGLED